MPVNMPKAHSTVLKVEETAAAVTILLDLIYSAAAPEEAEVADLLGALGLAGWASLESGNAA